MMNRSGLAFDRDIRNTVVVAFDAMGLMAAIAYEGGIRVATRYSVSVPYRTRAEVRAMAWVRCDRLWVLHKGGVLSLHPVLFDVQPPLMEWSVRGVDWIGAGWNGLFVWREYDDVMLLRTPKGRVEDFGSLNIGRPLLVACRNPFTRIVGTRGWWSPVGGSTISPFSIVGAFENPNGISAGVCEIVVVGLLDGQVLCVRDGLVVDGDGILMLQDN